MPSLTLSRARAHGRLLAALGVTAIVLVFALASAVGWLTDAVRAAVVATVDAAAESDRHTALSVPVAGDPADQAARVDALLRARFGDSLHVDRAIAAADGSSTWTLTVDPDRFVPWTIAWTAAGLDDLAVAVRAEPGLAPEGASTDGGLADTLDAATPSVLAVASVVPVPLALTAIGGLIAVLQLARLLGRSRGGELSLLRARGMDAATARRAAYAEAAAVVTAGAALGWLAAAAAVALLGGIFVVALAATWPVPVVAVIALTVTGAVGQLRAGAVDAADRGGRARAAVTGIGAGLVVLAAALALWQLAGLQGDAAALTRDPWSLVVIAVAPALGLAAVAAIALLLFGPVSALAARVAASRLGLSPAFPARMVARHVTSFGVVVALLALASGGAALAGTAITTWGAAAADTAVLATGADVRARPATGDVVAAPVAQAAAGPGVDSAAAVLTDAADAGGAGLQVVAVPESSIASLLNPLPAAGVDPAALAAAVAGDGPVGAPIGDASAVTMTFAVVAGGGGDHPTIPDTTVLAGEAWFVDGLGTPARVQLDLTMANDESTHAQYERYPGFIGGPIDDVWTRGTLTATASLPSGSGDWTFIGFSLGFGGTVGSQAPTLTPEHIDVVDGDAVQWPSTTPVTLDAEHPETTMPFADPPTAVPVVVSAALADALALDLGGTFELVLDRSGRHVPAQISAIVRAVPGTTKAEAALVPLDQATLTMLGGSGTAVAANEVWASGDGGAAAVRAAMPDAALTVASDVGAFTQALVVPWWIAIGAAAVLAGIALVAAALGMAQQRATDVFVLRALGIAAVRQARSRTAELVAVAIGAVVAGAALGFALAYAAVPALTRVAVAGVPEVLSGDVTPGFAPLAAAVVVAAAALVVAAAGVGRLVARDARAGRVREAA